MNVGCPLTLWKLISNQARVRVGNRKTETYRMEADSEDLRVCTCSGMGQGSVSYPNNQASSFLKCAKFEFAFVIFNRWYAL
jgi:hypothetical protein